jgi:hypothetical protein
MNGTAAANATTKLTSAAIASAWPVGSAAMSFVRPVAGG